MPLLAHHGGVLLHQVRYHAWLESLAAGCRRSLRKARIYQRMNAGSGCVGRCQAWIRKLHQSRLPLVSIWWMARGVTTVCVYPRNQCRPRKTKAPPSSRCVLELLFIRSITQWHISFSTLVVPGKHFDKALSIEWGMACVSVVKINMHVPSLLQPLPNALRPLGQGRFVIIG